MVLADLGTLLLVALLALLIAGALAPLETLGWWAGWFGHDRRDQSDLHPAPGAPPPRERYLVFLSGIHSVSHDAYADREIALLERLTARMPTLGIVPVFPYSVTNRALTGQRVFAWFWRWLLARKINHRQLAGITGQLINLRNLWQVAVSADRRFGPLYNQGSGDLILRTLCEHGYDPERAAPLTLVGYSGGAQIATGAAPYLHELLGVPVDVISLGGVLSADPGIEAIDHLYLLIGERDRVQRLGALVFPGRWPLLPHSSWNRARQRGRITRIDLGPVNHTGRGGYLDDEAHLADGRSYLEQTVHTIIGIVAGIGALPGSVATSP